MKVLLPYGFLLEYNHSIRMSCFLSVLLPYGFLLEYNKVRDAVTGHPVLLPYGFLLEYNSPIETGCRLIVLLPYGFLLEYNVTIHSQPKPVKWKTKEIIFCLKANQRLSGRCDLSGC